MRVRTTPTAIQRPRPLSLAVAGALVILSGACTQSPTRTTRARGASQVDLYPRILRLDALGEGRTLGAGAWQTLDPSVATVDGNGNVRAVGNGTTYAVVRVQGKTDTAQVTVSQKAVRLTITPALDTIRALGATERLVAKGFDRNGNPVSLSGVLWSAANPDVVTVDADGVARGLKKGTGRIRATIGNLKADAKIIVDPAVAAIRLSPADASLRVGDSLTFNVAATDSLGNATSTPPLTWASTDTAVASVAQGRVTARTAGNTTITAKSGTLSAAAVVAVSELVPSPVTRLLLAPDSAALEVSAAVQLTATALDSSGAPLAGRAVTWSSSTPEIATVSSDGLVTGVAIGHAIVSASSEGATAQTAVTVVGPTSAPVASIEIAPASDTLALGEAFQLIATLKDAKGNVITGRAIQWASSAPSVIAVSSTGIITALAIGAATVSASCDSVVGLAQITAMRQSMPASTVVVTPSSSNLAVGATLQLTAAATDSSGTPLPTDSAVWTSSNDAVATVSSTGFVTAVSTGAATVAATIAGKSAAAAVTVVAPTGFVQPELPRVSVDTRMPAVTGRVISVPAGGDLQQALNNAQPGDAVELAAGATFTGNYVLPPKDGSSYILVRSSAWRTLPPEGTRVGPAAAGVMARVMSPNTDPALSAPKGSSYWRVIGLEMAAAPATSYTYAIVSAQAYSPASLADYPHHIIFDRVYVHPLSDALSVQRCVTLNAAYAAVIDSYLAGCHYNGTDAQAIVAWDTPGPIKISNDYLEGSGENVMIGGAGTAIAGLVPSDVEITRNHFMKPRSWIGSAWTIKNLFETKNVRRILVEGNIFENNWSQAQTGTAIVLKSNGENCPQAVLEDMTFRYNIIKNSPKGIVVVGTQENYYPHNYVEPINNRILIAHNIFDNVGDTSMPGAGEYWIFQVYHGGANITIDHNTVSSGATLSLMMFSSQTTGTFFRFTNNLADLGPYGVKGDGSLSAGFGSEALQAFYPGYVFAGNVLGVGTDQNPTAYPSGNFWPSSRDALGLVNFALPAASPYSGQATDGTNPGADVPVVLSRTAGVQ